MRNAPRILAEIGWNKRALTYADFEHVCVQVGAKVFFTDEESEGMHFFRRGYPIIVLNRKLSGFKLLQVAWHELIHCLLHPPALRYFAKGTLDKIELEANDLALCCVLPLPTLKRILTGTPDEWLYPRDILQDRCELFVRHGI